MLITYQRNKATTKGRPANDSGHNVKHRRCDTNSIPAIKADQWLITDRKGVAEMLSTTNSNLFSPRLTIQFPTYSLHYPNTATFHRQKPDMKNLLVGKGRVLTLFRDLRLNKATELVGISARLEMAEVLVEPLCNIFNISLKHNAEPCDWRHANITPIFRKGEKCKSENYRPINLTCSTTKNIEHISTSHIITFIERHNILNPRQHGFEAKLSCKAQLVKLTINISKK